MNNPLWIIISLFARCSSQAYSECVTQENSLEFISLCNIKKIFSDIESPKLENFRNFFRISGTNLELQQSLDRENLINNRRCDSSTMSNYASEGQCVLIVELLGTGPRFYQIPILVADVNDNVPLFDRSHFLIKIHENAPPNLEVELPQARDPDRGSNGTVVYSLQTSEIAHRFMLLNPSLRGGQDSPLKLRVLRPFDRETEKDVILILVASDHGSPALSSSLTMTIEILDVNDHAPYFNQSTYRFTVPESMTHSQQIGQVHALDSDVSGIVTVLLSPSASAVIFDSFIVSADGVISTKVALEYSADSHEYRIPVIATDGGAPVLTATVTVTVNIIDVNDHSPSITVTPSDPGNRLLVNENCPGATYVAKVTVQDKDYGANGQIECTLLGDLLFTLEQIQIIGNRRFYKLMTAPSSQFDRETMDRHSVTVVCHDGGVPSLTTTTSDTVIVVDDNDNGPVFLIGHMNVNVPENRPVGTVVATLSATDKDIGHNARTRYRLIEETNGLFSIDSVSGIVFTQAILDRESTASLVFTVTAYDDARPTLTSNVTVLVTVLDENDNAPIFVRNYSFQVLENNAGYVGRVTATDNDDGNNKEVEYFLVTRRIVIFSVSRSGDIVIVDKRGLDRESVDRFMLEVGARDKGRPSMTSVTTVQIVVEDVNDNDPVFLAPRTGYSVVNVSFNTEIGTRIFTAQAIDRDAGPNGDIVYSMRPQSLFIINSTEGIIVLNGTLTRERDPPVKLLIFAQDRGIPPLTSTTSLFINYVREGVVMTTRDNRKVDSRRWLSRDLILTLGIGAVVLIIASFIFVMICVYVTMYLQKIKESKGAVNLQRHKASDWLCNCLSRQSYKEGHRKEGIITHGGPGLGISAWEQTQDYPVCFTRLGTKTDLCIEEEPLYAYRQFNTRTAVDVDGPGGIIYDHVAHVTPVHGSYWQYNTLGGPRPHRERKGAVYNQGTTLSPRRAHHNIVYWASSDQLDTAIYDQISPSIGHHRLKSPVIGQMERRVHSRTDHNSDADVSSPEILVHSTNDHGQSITRFAGYVVGRPCYTNSFV